MTATEKDPLAEAVARLADNAYWRHYVSTLVTQRDASVHKLLYGSAEEAESLRGEARAFDQMINKLRRNGAKI